MLLISRYSEYHAVIINSEIEKFIILIEDNGIFLPLYIAENKVAKKHRTKRRTRSTMYKRMKGEDQLRIIW